MEITSSSINSLDVYTQTAGSTTLTSGTLSASGGVDIQGGSLNGTGTVGANVSNAGQVNPGGSAGILNVTGNYTQSASGVLNIEIGGLNAGSEHDRHAITGTATLAGTLNISLINSYVPNLGDSFVIMTFASRSGDFATYNGLMQANGLTFTANFSATALTLEVTQGVYTPTPTVTQTFTPSMTPTLTPTPTPLCGATPRSGCRTPGKSLLLLKDDSDDDSHDKLIWKWLKGQETLLAALGTPETATRYGLCVYDAIGLVLSAEVPPGGTCDAEPCWNPLGSTGFKYKDVAGSQAGLTKVLVKSGADGKAKMIVKGKGIDLPDPTLGLTFDVTAQLANSLGECWTATYTSPAIKNTSAQFKDKLP